jgi:hypothetical protein
MITNGCLTIFHKGLDADTRLEKWIRFNYSNVWFFGGEGAGINKGYDNANDFDCRIPYDQNGNLNAKNFAIGDIVVNDNIDYDISNDDELDEFKTFNITSINDNNFGTRPHIHIGGK